MRELYVFKETKHIAGKIGTLLEQVVVPIADCVIVANEYRAKYVFKNYHTGV